MYGRKKSLLVGSFLKLVSIFYGPIVRLRQGLYRSGLIKQVKLKQSVISVGNITVGGTGKTPAVMQIARVLLKHQRHPVVVSRGYGRKDENALTVVSDGKQVLADPGTGGDEPVLIGSKVPGVPVIAASDRLQAALYAHEKFRNNTVVLDDGFQHIRLARDLDIVLVDAVDPFGNGKLFPAGILREPLSALRRADVVVITHADRAADLPALRKAISLHTGARIFTSQLVPVDLVDIETREQKPLSALQGVNVLVFSGIARHELFVSVLRALGAEVKADIRYPDHYTYNKFELAAIRDRSSHEKISMVVTTEKDGVRLRNLKPEGVWALRVELRVSENEEWEAVLLNL